MSGWQERALCAQTDPELFFLEKGQNAGPAKRTCFACPVRQECLTYALETGQEHGIWGGHTPMQLRELRRAAGIVLPAARELAECGTHAAYKRHRRNEGKPVTCGPCLAAEARRARERNRDAS